MNRLPTILLLLIFLPGYAQLECPTLITPLNGATDVRLDAIISWTEVQGVNGYLLSISTRPGINDILDNEMVGAVTSYTLASGLPPQTTIYVTISPFYFNQAVNTCPPQTFTTIPVSDPPDCTQLNSPANGAIDVSRTPTLEWDYAYGASGYFISAGSTPGGNDYLDMEDAGNTTRYTITSPLPAETAVYVRITPYNSLGTSSGCTETFFTTRSSRPVPACTLLLAPADGDTNVPLTTRVNWEEVPEASGYIVSMGYTPGISDILDNAVYYSPSASVLDFLPNSTIYVTITPFNEAGEATGCITESFATSAGCGPYTDPVTGVMVNLNPQLDIPDTVGVCGKQPLRLIQDPIPGYSYAWYSITGTGVELLSEAPDFSIEETGSYLLEVTDTVDLETPPLVCTGSQSIEVVFTDVPELTAVNFSETPAGITIDFTVNGTGDYTFAINAPGGPFTPSTSFTVPEQDSYTLYIKEDLACGIIPFDLNPIAFPAFFTPNGDGINDLWKPLIIGASQPELLNVTIFDRYGKLLIRMDALHPGWNGEFNGSPLVPSDYWYRAVFEDGTERKGHFSLRR
ncbi:T9SS type B sorting domain-containing protein [Robertkochia flava]|uniref:T9SS type B sorting domain-containing protein n=1 Tax=Robertkochia flava TaxID=3447986 RepID=UPI001CCF14BB|nr:T9SS type B sorting domain-containing protein [Robertkochia marina]